MQALATCTWLFQIIAAVVLAAAGCTRSAHALDWQVDITPAGDLFPALQLSQAQHAARGGIGGGDGLVSVRIDACAKGAASPDSTCASEGDRIHLRIDTAGLRQSATVEADRDPQTALILKPRFEWDAAALRNLHTVRHQPMQITLNGEIRTFQVRVHPLDDALYFVREGSDHVDLGWAFAGYVNPQASVVDEVLALAHGLDAGFSAAPPSEGRADPEANLHRVAAVWAALEKHGMRYATDNPALSQGPHAFSQRVRLPGEAWRERRANCIDGSVLIASVLERLRIRAFIVLVPGHAFVRFDTGAGAHNIRYLETTLLGAMRDRRDRSVGRGFDVPRDFDAALRAGMAHWRRVATRLDGRHGPEYALIDIETARSYGIIPLSGDDIARDLSGRGDAMTSDRN